MKMFSRYWGYLFLLLVMAGWMSKDIGPGFIALVSVAATTYFLFAAPMWCGARTRKGQYCRRNSRGLLVGCHERQHKWQTAVALVGASEWKERCGLMFRGLGRQAATISALAAVVSAAVATATFVVS